VSPVRRDIDARSQLLHAAASSGKVQGSPTSERNTGCPIEPKLPHTSLHNGYRTVSPYLYINLSFGFTTVVADPFYGQTTNQRADPKLFFKLFFVKTRKQAANNGDRHYTLF
jgi:hypothetical protein